MSWEMLLLLLILGLPLLGAAVGGLGRRRLPARAGALIAAITLFLAAAGLIVLVRSPLVGRDLGEVLPLPQGALRDAPTSNWVQPPRTLVLPPTSTPTVSPTLAVTPTPTLHPLASATVAVRNGTGKPGLAGRTADLLVAQGFNVVEVENDPEVGSRPHTLILDRGDHPEVRQALAGFLGISSDYVEVGSDEAAQADIVVVLGDDFQE